MQGLAADGCALMWALVDVNPTALASFVSCNLEVPHQRRNASPDLWACVLVSELFENGLQGLVGLRCGK